MLNIKDKQNSPEILNLLFLQRIYCEKIEHNTIGIYILTIIIPIIGFFTQNCYYLIALNFFLILFCNYLTIKRKKLISMMATAKEIIDRTLFNLELTNVQLECSKESIEEAIIKEKEKNSERYRKEINNNGTDSYRGVKDWYSYNDTLEDNQIILECQNENVYFTKKLSKSFINLISILVGIIIIIIIVFNSNITIKNILIYYLYPFATFITLIWNDILNYRDFKNILERLELEFGNLKKMKNIETKDLEEIQNLIYLYRKTEYRPPLDIFHKKDSKMIHKIWRKTKINI